MAAPPIEQGAPSNVEPRRRVVAAVTAAPSSERVIEHAAALAEQTGAELLGVHVDDGRHVPPLEQRALDGHRTLLERRGGRLEYVVAADPAEALVDFAIGAGAAQLVLGTSRRRPLTELARGSLIHQVARGAERFDVVIVATQDPGPPSRVARRPTLLPRRLRMAGWASAIAGTAVVTAGLRAAGDVIGQGGQFLLYLVVVVAAALGGRAPAITAALVSAFALNWFFTPPLHTWVIDDAENALALGVFLAVGLLVGFLVTSVARRSADARRGRAEAEVLARIASEMIVAEDPLPPMLERIRTTLGLEGISLHADPSAPAIASAGASPSPADQVRGGGSVVIRVRGTVAPEDERLLDAFLAQLAATVERRDLRREAERVEAVAAADRLRTALLRAVSHDLRTPLASIKASVTSLLQADIRWTPGEQHEFLETIDEEVDRLDKVVGNLLDASRLEAGVVQPSLRPVALDDVVAAALTSISGLRGPVRIDVSPDLPLVRADPGLLERAIANVVANASEASPADGEIRITGRARSGHVELAIADQGPGVPLGVREVMFEPFSRLGDSGGGVGLGLSVARGVVEAMGGRLSAADGPDGGLTMVLTVPVAGDA